MIIIIHWHSEWNVPQWLPTLAREGGGRGSARGRFAAVKASLWYISPSGVVQHNNNIQLMMRRALTASLVTQPGSNPAHLCAAAPTISRHYFMTILMCFPCPRPRHPSLISPTEPVKPTGIRLRIPSEPGETQEEKQQEQHQPTASATVT